MEWTQQEEAKYQAALLAAEVKELHRKQKSEEAAAAKKAGPDSSKSPKPHSR